MCISFLVLQARRLECPLCRHTGTRYFRLKTHAEAKHGLRRDGASMTRFMAKCRKINARGVRVTANSDLQRILGQFARSPSHIRVAKRVLRHCASVIDTDQQRNSPFTEPHSNKTRALHGPDAMPSTTTYARQRRADIDSAGLVAHFGKLCVSADAYLLSNSWKTCSLATATANARMVHRFLSWAKNQTEHIDDEEIQLLCDPDLPHEFVRVLSSVLKPYSVKNHVTAMYGFIDAVIWNKQLQLGIKCADGLKAQLKTIREIWLRLKGDTQRLARRKQRAVTRSGQFANAPILWIIQFLNQSGKKCDKLMKDPLMESAHLLETVRCVCATYLALHGQRLSSILNLTLKEINAANYTQGRFVLRIQNHKTSKTSGPASIALKPHQYKLIKFMAETYGGKGRGDKAFPIRESGRTSSILFKPLNAFIRSRSGHQDTAITCNKIRKTIESNKYLVGGESSEKSRAVSSYLMHGKNVTDLHYSFKTDYMVVYEGRLVESVVSSLVFLDLVRDGTVPLAAADGKEITYLLILLHPCGLPPIRLNMRIFVLNV